LDIVQSGISYRRRNWGVSEPMIREKATRNAKEQTALLEIRQAVVNLIVNLILIVTMWVIGVLIISLCVLALWMLVQAAVGAWA
jgi:hypothetical protein